MDFGYAIVISPAITSYYLLCLTRRIEKESEILNSNSSLVKSVVMKNVHLMQQTFLKFAFVIRHNIHNAAL